MKNLIGGKLVDFTPEEVVVAQSEQAERNAKSVAAHLSAYRYKVETGGIEINGIKIQTDPASRANILGARQLGISIKWKTPEGFVTLSPEQVSAVAVAVGTHIQKCFAVEAALSSQTFDTIEDLETAFNKAMEN